MTYKERVQGEIIKREDLRDRENLKDLWQKICESYEQGGVEQIKLKLDSLVGGLKEKYKQELESLKKKL